MKKGIDNTEATNVRLGSYFKQRSRTQSTGNYVSSRACRSKWLTVGLTMVLFFSTGFLLACQVPVFRYALERWNPEAYPVVVITPKKLTAEEKRQWVGDSPERFAPYARLEWSTANEVKDPELLELWNAAGDKSGMMVAYYPEKSELRRTIAHTAPLAPNSFASLLTSPARKEIAKRLVAGESAVWVLLESGDAEKDQTARTAIETQLTLDKEWLKIPTPEEMEIKPEILDSLKIKLKIDFSVLSLRRDDPEEQFLVNCLLNSEEDLRHFEEPIAFPIFGRGLVLYALVGKGINGDTVRAASKFICGPCSCQVKEQNPGFDLLLEHRWDESVGEVFVTQSIPGVGAQPKLLTIPPGRKK